MLQVPIANYDEFLTIDKNLPCHDDNEDCEDSIVEDDDDGELPVPVTNQETKQQMATLQLYFMQEGNEGSSLSELNICAEFIQQKCMKNFKQTTLDSFLS